MAMKAPDVEVTRVELAPAAKLFRSLGDPARLAIVRAGWLQGRLGL
ncbi:hypothetical protein [Mycobacterium intracellulare]